MRKVMIFLVAVMLTFGVIGVVTAQDNNPNNVPPILPDLGGRTIVAVSSNDYVPFSFLDTVSSKITGFEYDLLDELCRRLNCKLDHKTAEWAGMIEAVSRGEYDLGHVGITIKDERKEKVDFSEPFVVVEQKLLVRADETRYDSLKAFLEDKDAKFGAQPGTTSYFSAEYFVDDAGGDVSARVVPYAKFALAVEALINGDIDAVVTDAVSGVGFISASAGKLKLIDEVISLDPLGLIFPKGSDLVAPFNLALASLEYDGFLTYLETKWFFIYQPPASE
ncbi:MAG TPA: ABC transporter substrate-binding protein [Aggregatilineales bacterium]|nr:amino acid ABC transporter substrate-binding protein [Anaerolineales bacterium]HRE49726.1 ABC transporter substrate-binding protein [Aggregatilineales bacterium]